MQLQNLRQTDLAEKTGFSRARISQWISGKYQANQNGIFALAQALNVSEAWLMGFDVEKHTDKEVLKLRVELESLQERTSKEALQIIKKFYLLPKGQQKIVSNLIDSLLVESQDD